MLKRFTLLLAAIVMAIPSLFAQEPLYLLTVQTLTSAWSPSADDQQLSYDAATGFYSSEPFMMGKGTIMAPSEYPNAFIFYTKDSDDNIHYIGAIMSTAIDFTLNNPYVKDFEPSNSLFWINKFFDPKSTSGEVQVSVNIKTGILIATQVNIVDNAPDFIYLWGTDNGGASALVNMATLTPSEADPNIFSVDFEVPYVPGPFVYDDPEMKPTEEDAPTSGFMFQLSPEGTKLNQSSVTVFLAPINGRTILEGENDVTIQLARKQGGSVIDQNPGLTRITFNYKTLELNMVNLDPDAPKPGPGTDPDDPNTPDNPDDPNTPDNPDDPNTPDNPDDSGVAGVTTADALLNVFNMQGVQVLSGASAADFNNLPAGVYIVNGKKVVK